MKILATDDWLARHPKVIAIILFSGYILASWLT